MRRALFVGRILCDKTRESHSSKFAYLMFGKFYFIFGADVFDHKRSQTNKEGLLIALFYKSINLNIDNRQNCLVNTFLIIT